MTNPVNRLVARWLLVVIVAIGVAFTAIAAVPATNYLLNGVRGAGTPDDLMHAWTSALRSRDTGAVAWVTSPYVNDQGALVRSSLVSLGGIEDASWTVTTPDISSSHVESKVSGTIEGRTRVLVSVSLRLSTRGRWFVDGFVPG